MVHCERCAAQTRFNEIFNTYKNVHFVHSNYKDADQILSCIHGQTVDKVLLDLGTSSFQLDQDTRGFSFQKDTPLKMTFSEAGSHTGFDAYDIVNSWDEENIADILFYYGEEPKARVIAKAIVAARKVKEIKTTQDLVNVVLTVIKKKSKINPATKTFQALRIAVNDEYQVIKSALDNWYEKLNKGGRIAVITFHSVEDRIVKHWMKAHERVITKKPLAPTREELLTNPRSRSAKLRVIEKI